MSVGSMVETGRPEGMIERRRYSREPGTRAVDFAYLKRFTFGNRELEREVLYLFAQSMPGYLEALRGAATPKAWHDAAHTLKGSARAVGAWRVARAAEMAERTDRQRDADRCSFALDILAEAIDEAVGYIVEVFPQT